MRNSVPTRIVANVGDLAAALTGLSSRWAIGALLSVAFAGLALRMRGVTPSGAVAGTIVCFILYLGGSAGAFAGLVMVFALAWITTRLGYPHKQKLGIAERREGRKASQVVANLGVATGCAALYVFGRQQRVILLALAAALSEAAADTVSSEVGQAFGERAINRQRQTECRLYRQAIAQIREHRQALHRMKAIGAFVANMQK